MKRVIVTDAREFGFTLKGARNVYFGVGYVAEGAAERKVYQGPLVPGPWAYAFGRAMVIDNHGGTGAEMARKRAVGLHADLVPGDVLVIDGHAYVASVNRDGYNVDLTPEAL